MYLGRIFVIFFKMSLLLAVITLQLCDIKLSIGFLLLGKLDLSSLLPFGLAYVRKFDNLPFKLVV